MPSVFILSTGADTGGFGINSKRALDRHTDWKARSMHTTLNYIRYPIDMIWNATMAQKMFDAADVVQLRNDLAGWRMFGRGTDKPMLLHHHGTIYRNTHARLWAEAEALGAVQTASTLDLTMLEPHVRWLPMPYDLDVLRTIRAGAQQRNAAIRIAHAPTNRPLKQTGVLLAAVEIVRRKHPVELILIEGKPHAECLRRKADADIFFDQLHMGYGNNAIEAMAMGIPVISGALDQNVTKLMRRTWGQLPYEHATPGTLAKVLLTLVESADARAEVAARGTAHVERYHADAAVAPLLVELYGAAMSRRRAAA